MQAALNASNITNDMALKAFYNAGLSAHELRSTQVCSQTHVCIKYVSSARRALYLLTDYTHSDSRLHVLHTIEYYSNKTILGLALCVLYKDVQRINLMDFPFK